MAGLFILWVFARNLLKENCEEIFFHISFWCLTWDTNPDFTANNPAHYLVDYEDFIVKNTQTIMYVNNNVYNIYRDFKKVKPRTFHFNNIHHAVYSATLKARWSRRLSWCSSVTLVWRHDMFEECNRGLKINVTKICWIIV